MSANPDFLSGSTAVVAIYALVDPDTGEPRYIGKTHNPKARMQYHCSPSGRVGRAHRYRWLASLYAAGKRPIMEIVSWVDAAFWPEAEKYVIAECLRAGFKLTNTGPGGEGWPTGPESRMRFLKRMLSKVYTDFIKSGHPECAARHATRLRWLYRQRPNIMPKRWATIGL